MTRFVRSDSGRVVHRRGCPCAVGPTPPWIWAELRTRRELEAVAAIYGLEMCEQCRPLEAVGEVAA